MVVGLVGRKARWHGPWSTGGCRISAGGGWRDCGLARDARESIGVLTLVGWVREKKGDSTIRILIDDGGRKGRLMEEIWACGLMKGWRRGLGWVGSVEGGTDLLSQVSTKIREALSRVAGMRQERPGCVLMRNNEPLS